MFLLSRSQLRASAARRAAWHGRGQPQRRSITRVCVITRTDGLTSILNRKQFL